MKKTLIEEALDDARQVRETALANAKLALEEAFEPRIKSMIARSIQAESADEDEDDEEDEITEKDDFTIKDPTNADTAVINTESDADDMDDLELDEADDEDDEDDEGDEGDEDTDLDLESIIAELESEMDDDMDDDMGEGYGKPKKSLKEKDDDELDATADDDLEEGESDDLDIDLEELLGLSEEDDIEDDELAEGDDDEDEDDIDLEELLSMSEIGTDEKKDKHLATENKRLSSELTEHREAIEILRTKLNEVNLLNAKLLYTTKLFKKYSLDNSQKMKVVESFDRTKTVREAKLIYTTLSESLASGRTSKNKSNRRASNSLTEGLASSVVKSTKPINNIITESNDVTNRFKKLISYNK